MRTSTGYLAAAAAIVGIACAPGPAPSDPPGDSAAVANTPATDTTFRAHGQEPGWLVAVFGGDSISFLLDYGEQRFATPAPPPESLGDTVVWRTTHDTLAIEMRAVRTLCTDVMRGDSFPARVTLRLGDRSLDGCGRWPTGTSP